jgi:MarR family 2-MHQ and catechol resistance regulon transcriptional repressor
MKKSTQKEESTQLTAAFLERMRPEGFDCADRPVAADVFCHIYLLNSVLERMGNRCAEQHSLTMPQWMALGCIAFGGATGVTHSELGARLMLSKAPITGVVDRLEREALVHRESDEHDRRISRIVITTAGEAKWHDVRRALHDCSLEICAAIAEPEQRVLLSLLAKLLDAAAHSDPILSALKGGTPDHSRN